MIYAYMRVSTPQQTLENQQQFPEGSQTQ